MVRIATRVFFLSRASASALRILCAALCVAVCGHALAATFVNPIVAHGKDVFAVQACDACHGADARGTDSAPSLVGAAARYRNGELKQVIKVPNAKMSDGGMQPLEAPDPDIDALVAYLESLK